MFGPAECDYHVYSSNKSLEPTAGRCEVHVSFYETVLDVCYTRRRQRWLSSFSLDAEAFLDSIAITSRRWHTAGDARCCSSVSDTAHCYFGSTLSFSGFCAVAHPANAPQSHSGGGAPDSFRLSHDIRCFARGERCILGAGRRADHRAVGCDLAGRSLRADGDALLFRRATLCLGRSSDCYCRRYIVGCCVRPMSLAHQASSQAMQRTASHPAIYFLGVCHPPYGCVTRFTGLAVADLVSR